MGRTKDAVKILRHLPKPNGDPVPQDLHGAQRARNAHPELAQALKVAHTGAAQDTKPVELGSSGMGKHNGHILSDDCGA